MNQVIDYLSGQQLTNAAQTIKISFTDIHNGVNGFEAVVILNDQTFRSAYTLQMINFEYVLTITSMEAKQFKIPLKFKVIDELILAINNLNHLN